MSLVKSFEQRHPEVELIECLLPDLNGVIRGKWAPISALAKIEKSGLALPLSVFGLDLWGNEVRETGLHVESGDEDGYCRPILDTLRPAPWLGANMAQVLMFMTTANGTPFDLDPRNILTTLAKRLNKLGLSATVAFELEFYLISNQQYSQIPHPGTKSAFIIANQDTPQGKMYDFNKLHKHAALLHEIQNGAKIQALPIDTIIAEGGEAQYEINLLHTSDPCVSTDHAILLRRLITCLTRQYHPSHQNLHATFMPKPTDIWPGNGMHVHISLYNDSGQNAFGEADGGEERLKYALGGLLASLPDALAGFVSSYNGYRRITPDSYAPTRLSWGYNNRSVALRIPDSPASARRIEHRVAGADAHPAIVLSAILGGILHGLEKQLSPGQPVTGNAYEGSAESFSLTMPQALDRWRNSHFIAKTFGDKFQQVFAQIKQSELEQFQNEITPLERQSYL